MSQIKLGLYLTSVICSCKLLQLIPVTYSFVRLKWCGRGILMPGPGCNHTLWNI